MADNIKIYIALNDPYEKPTQLTLYRPDTNTCTTKLKTPQKSVFYP
jgi:hypothetical protein